MSSVQLGFIVPTMNRLSELNRLLQSIYQQSQIPSTIIIVDASDTDHEQSIIRDDRIEIIYLRELPPSLTRQRNRGIAAIPERLTHVGFLDDDIVLLDGACSKLISFIEAEGPTLGGVSFNIVEERSKPNRLMLFLMGLAPLKDGGVSRSGSVSSNVAVTTTRYCDWLCGGATVWRRDVFSHFKFDEWYQGYAYWEDVDFSYRVGKRWKLAVLADARVLHLHIPVTANRKKMAYLGDVEIVDRFHFVHNHRSEMSYCLALWASFGTIFRNMLVGLRQKNPYFIARIKANLSATIRCSLGNIQRQNRLKTSV